MNEKSKRNLKIITIFINLISLIFGIVSIILPWYYISISGNIDNKYYDTSVTFKLKTYECKYSEIVNNSSITKNIIKEYGQLFSGNECYPILPPTASMFTLGVNLMMSLVLIVIGFSFISIGILLQTLLFTKFQNNRYLKYTIVILSLITFGLYCSSYILTSNIHTNLQSFNHDDKTSTSSDEYTEKLCDTLWCKSFTGSKTNYDNLDLFLENINSKWKSSISLFISIFSLVLNLISIILTIFIKINKKNQHYYVQLN